MNTSHGTHFIIIFIKTYNKKELSLNLNFAHRKNKQNYLSL
ncbi:hypothetical protein N483_14615 [Pseudoalteromonas luteoviolacea NCIMB 1944]|nr:hypothetical protein N483_14615 [Pseudoalteromonas luteoviolacea NCIMB 1944]